jgi:hypothetical protein
MLKRTPRRGATRLVCCALLAVLLLSPAGASAKRIFDIKHRGVSVTISMRGSHGYRVWVESVGRGHVRLSAEKGGGFLALLFGRPDLAAAYVVRGRVTRDRLRANFGKLGFVSVRFHRRGRPTPGGTIVPVHCKGRQPIREHGRFVGSIRFRGEHGFSRVNLRAARGTVVRRFKRSCGFHSGRRPEGAARPSEARPRLELRATVLGAAARRAGRTAAVAGLRLESPPGKGEEGGSLTFLAAWVAEHRGRIEIRRSAEMLGDEGTLLFSPPGVEPARTTMVAPNPFSGTGVYLEEPGSPPSWTGSLSVHLPGEDPVPLAGRRFTAALCREKTLNQAIRCLSRIEKVTEGAKRSSISLGLRRLGA